MANLIKNKYILTIATVVIFGLTIALGSLYAKDRIERNDLLNESDAVKFAYVDAGISPKSAPSYEAKLLKEDGIYVYKVVISSDDTKYKYTIAANNGEVISSESARIAKNKKNNTTSSDTTGVEENDSNNDSNKANTLEKNGKNVISNAKSKDKPNANKTTDNQTTGSTAVNDVAENDKPAKGKSDVKNVADNTNANNNMDDKKPDKKNSNDNIDGKKASGKKASGKKKRKKNVVGNNRHHTNTDNDTNNTSTGKTSTVSEVAASRHYISMDMAKSITLKDAGFRPSFVTFEKALLKKDDGKVMYEIEFFTSTYEYEYEVDAYTGAILSKDVDPLSPSDKAEKVKENSSNTPKNADLEDYEKKHDKDDEDDDDEDDDKKKYKDDDDDDDD